MAIYVSFVLEGTAFHFVLIGHYNLPCWQAAYTSTVRGGHSAAPSCRHKYVPLSGLE
jgi:hypothetical protein